MISVLIRWTLLTALLAAAWLLWYALSSSARAVYPMEVSLPQGSTLKQVAAQLHADGVIGHPLAFTLLGRLSGKSGQIKAGSYLLDAPIAPWALLRKITQGETLLGKITFIEGWTFRQMRAALDKHPRLRHDSSGLGDAELLAKLSIQYAHPEGLFFPDTYYFDSGSSDLALLARAHEHMVHTLNAAWQARLPDLPYETPYDALIMASIIEKETSAPEERARIAGVFVNRLRIAMRLQTDPTVIYGLGAHFDGNLRKNDLLQDGPYNTYTRAGLPPTPIALPGGEAIHAALNPDRHRALYFVSMGNGRHQFSASLEEHNRAVARYQQGGR